MLALIPSLPRVDGLALGDSDRAPPRAATGVRRDDDVAAAGPTRLDLELTDETSVPAVLAVSRLDFVECRLDADT